MPSFTSFLNLYKPGGGSTGLILPDEVVDVDRFNANSDLIDAFAAGWGNAAARNHQFYGPAAARVGVAGMKRGDTYQESDSSGLLWTYNGTSWVVLGTIFVGSVGPNIPHTHNVIVSWGAAGAPYTEEYDPLATHDATTNPTQITVPWAGLYRISTRKGWATNTAGGRVVIAYKNGVQLVGSGQAFLAADNSGGNISPTITERFAANDYIVIGTRQTSGGALNLTEGELVVEYLGAA